MKLSGTTLGGQTAVISGGTGGIGQAIAVRLAAEGARVVLLGRDQGRLDTACAAVAEQLPGTEFLTQVIDIASEASVTAAVADLTGRLNRIDILVHAAGDAPIGSLTDTDDAVWAEALGGKLAGTIRLTRAVAAGMVERKAGSIVFINGAFANEPNQMFVAASTVVAALSAFAKAISHDLGRSGVRVNVVHPGATRTALWSGIANGLAQRFGCTPADIDGQVVGKTPLGRLGRAEDVAGAVAFLVSPAANHITGTALLVDGGASTAL